MHDQIVTFKKWFSSHPDEISFHISIPIIFRLYLQLIIIVHLCVFAQKCFWEMKTYCPLAIFNRRVFSICNLSSIQSIFIKHWDVRSLYIHIPSQIIDIETDISGSCLKTASFEISSSCMANLYHLRAIK